MVCFLPHVCSVVCFLPRFFPFICLNGRSTTAFCNVDSRLPDWARGQVVTSQVPKVRCEAIYAQYSIYGNESR